MRSPWARIVIVAYQSGEHLQDAINALVAQTETDFEVVIVDNACPDKSAHQVNLPNERFTISEAGSNLGFAGGCNHGAAGATSEWIITLNPDAAPLPDWLAKLKEAAERYPGAGMLSSTLLMADDPKMLDGFGDVYSIFGLAWRGGHGQPLYTAPQTDCEVLGPCGAAAAYRSDAYSLAGGFDPAFFCYLEDVDLALRLQALGYPCVQVRKAECLHVGSGSVGRGSDFQFFQTHKNMLRLLVKNAPIVILPPLLLSYAASQTYLLWRNRNNQGAIARWRGTKEGMRQLWTSRHSRKHTKRETLTTYSKRLVFKLNSVRKLPIIAWDISEVAYERQN